MVEGSDFPSFDDGQSPVPDLQDPGANASPSLPPHHKVDVVAYLPYLTHDGQEVESKTATSCLSPESHHYQLWYVDR